jgi:hypothetical protein
MSQIAEDDAQSRKWMSKQIHVRSQELSTHTVFVYKESRVLHQVSTELKDFHLGVSRAIESTHKKMTQFRQIAMSPQVDESETNDGMTPQTDDTGKVRQTLLAYGSWWNFYRVTRKLTITIILLQGDQAQTGSALPGDFLLTMYWIVYM